MDLDNTRDGFSIYLFIQQSKGGVSTGIGWQYFIIGLLVPGSPKGEGFLVVGV
jgi:hypothetical protein